MSTSICQGLQSCLEPGLAEPRVLRLKLALPNSTLSRSTPWNKPENLQVQEHQENDDSNEFHEVMKKKIKKGVDKNDDDDMKKMSGLSFLQALTAKNDTETEVVYVHPMVKRSASMLSAKSLEMCTESLGSETGSETGDSSKDEMSFLSAAPARQSPRAREVIQSPLKRLSRSRSFPPPLTSVSGSAGFQVRPHREDGRLVLKAVVVPSSSGLFHAERADGRLTLRLMKNVHPKNEEEEVEEEDDDEEKVEGETESEEEENEEGNGEEEETEEVKMGAEKIQRPSRCKEDGHGKNNVLMNWEPFLLTT